MTVITWDWKSSIDIEELNEALQEFGVSILSIEDTGCDERAVVIGKSPMTQEQANKEYKEYFNYDEGDNN